MFAQQIWDMEKRKAEQDALLTNMSSEVTTNINSTSNSTSTSTSSNNSSNNRSSGSLQSATVNRQASSAGRHKSNRPRFVMPPKLILLMQRVKANNKDGLNGSGGVQNIDEDNKSILSYTQNGYGSAFQTALNSRVGSSLSLNISALHSNNTNTSTSTSKFINTSSTNKRLFDKLKRISNRVKSKDSIQTSSLASFDTNPSIPEQLGKHQQQQQQQQNVSNTCILSNSKDLLAAPGVGLGKFEFSSQFLVDLSGNGIGNRNHGSHVGGRYVSTNNNVNNSNNGKGTSLNNTSSRHVSTSSDMLDNASINKCQGNRGQLNNQSYSTFYSISSIRSVDGLEKISLRSYTSNHDNDQVKDMEV